VLMRSARASERAAQRIVPFPFAAEYRVSVRSSRRARYAFGELRGAAEDPEHPLRNSRWILSHRVRRSPGERDPAGADQVERVRAAIRDLRDRGRCCVRASGRFRTQMEESRGRPRAALSRLIDESFAARSSLPRRRHNRDAFAVWVRTTATRASCSCATPPSIGDRSRRISKRCGRTSSSSNREPTGRRGPAVQSPEWRPSCSVGLIGVCWRWLICSPGG